MLKGSIIIIKSKVIKIILKEKYIEPNLTVKMQQINCLLNSLLVFIICKVLCFFFYLINPHFFSHFNNTSLHLLLLLLGGNLTKIQSIIGLCKIHLLLRVALPLCLLYLMPLSSFELPFIKISILLFLYTVIYNIVELQFDCSSFDLGVWLKTLICLLLSYLKCSI